MLRLHPCRLSALPKARVLEALITRAAHFKDPPSLGELKDLMIEVAKGIPDDWNSLRKLLENLAGARFLREPYPDGRGVVLTTRKRIKKSTSCFLPSLDEGDDETSRVGRTETISLDAHTRHVREALERVLISVRTSTSVAAYRLAAARHDWGRSMSGFRLGCAAQISPTPGSRPENRRRTWPKACRSPRPSGGRHVNARACPPGSATKCFHFNWRSVPASHRPMQPISN